MSAYDDDYNDYYDDGDYDSSIYENIIDLMHGSKQDDPRLKYLWDKLQSEQKTTKMDKRLMYVVNHFSSNDNNTYSSIEERFKICKDEWDVISVEEKKSFCICSKTPILHSFYIRNIINGNTLRIGSECIRKFSNAKMDNDSEILLKQITYNPENSSTKRRFCPGCKKNNIMPSSEFQICKPCWKKGKKPESVLYHDGRECESCHRLTIPSFAESWKTKCIDCFRKSQETPKTTSSSTPISSFRICEDCREPTIDPNDPSWKKICGPCYQHKMSSYRKCETCKKMVIKKDEPDWKKVCITCFKKSSRK